MSSFQQSIAKNTMIIAKKQGPLSMQLWEIRDIKETYGIRYHYLENCWK
ncbi:MAG: hypothetical protein IPH36_19615 [Saprospiraceae bacterium]|nr:hypothetical protein [Saprospiraceae bacterium]